jgi:putative tricarboxylic transport membrane protein
MADRIIFVCTVLLAGIYLWATSGIPTLELGDPLGPRVFPQILGVGLLIAAGMLLVEILRKKPQVVEADTVDDGPRGWRPQHTLFLLVVLWTAAFITVFEALGYVLASSAYLLVLTAYFNRGRWLMNVLTSVLFSLFSYLAFTHLLGVTLPRGVLPF